MTQEWDFEGHALKKGFLKQHSPLLLCCWSVSKAGRSKSKFLDESLLGFETCASGGLAIAGMAGSEYCCALAREVSK